MDPALDRPEVGKKWVIKIGSSLLMNGMGRLAEDRLAEWLTQIQSLLQQGYQIVLVSSGAIAVGARRMGWPGKPTQLADRQAAASVGQSILMHGYEKILHQIQRENYRPLHCGQVLLTHEELRNRSRYLNARETLRTLIEHGVLPIVNENDAISHRAIQLGDNDTLAALVANLWDADLLVLLTDQRGLYDADPRTHPDAQFIHRARAGEARLERLAGSGGSLVGTGGMLAKVKAAARAARSGTSTIIANGLEDRVILRIANQEAVGTLLEAKIPVLAARKRWLSDQLRVQGELHLDAGAAAAVDEEGASLLLFGVRAQQGAFRRSDLVSRIDPTGREIARGLVTLDARLLEHCRAQLAAGEEVSADCRILIHRDDLVRSR
ncbi:glutamate 5-kinase [Candidatus Igneacidithiobacillus taiwanensis]|uniref:glutamate 5-kinase n=1 Tax=Candidatus Igneacidithiobacillus taiwanensis TaxID=1945924 RepID=UPI00289D861E|nr:glutamate 5-kinase [Candidatus Igneacidithiobacillus taiwanensis]